jgi:leucyl aminopeptidase
MKYSLLTNDISQQKSDCLVALLADSKKFPDNLKFVDDNLNGSICKLLKSGDIKTGTGEISWLLTPEQAGKRILIIGIGKTNELSLTKLRKALAAGMTALNSSPVSQAIIAPVDFSANHPEQFDPARVVEEIILANETARYSFSQCKSKKQPHGKLKQILFTISKTDRGLVSKSLDKACALTKGIALAKDLGNLPGNICTPDYLAKQARELAKTYPNLTTTIMGEKEMQQLGMGSLLSVAAGSAEPPRLITIEYQGGKKNTKPHVLVGKGITFDTGGISLKPGAEMDEMKFDMCGAASVFGTLKVLAELKAPINVVGIVAAAENMPGSKATKPGDIVTSMSGQTIEILNTDAEGRLVLCDALTYCEKFKPETVVDIATLTGACVIALGNETAGLLANDEKLAQALLTAGQKAGDRAWQLPLFDEYQTLLDSNFADMQNIGGRAGGTITAACFLSRFTKKYRWAHLDIAGVAWHSGAKKGATGRPVGLLTEYLLAVGKAT